MRPYKLQYIYTQSHTQALHSESHTSYNTCIISLIPTPFTSLTLPHTQVLCYSPASCPSPATAHVYSDSYPNLLPESHSASYPSPATAHVYSDSYPNLLPESHSASYPSLVLQSSLIPKPSYTAHVYSRLIPKPCTRVPLSLIPNLVPESQVEMKYASLLDCNGYCHLMFFKK